MCLIGAGCLILQWATKLFSAWNESSRWSLSSSGTVVAFLPRFCRRLWAVRGAARWACWRRASNSRTRFTHAGGLVATSTATGTA